MYYIFFIIHTNNFEQWQNPKLRQPYTTQLMRLLR
jgi:hypothetical protein